ncbi:hypothetical protein [Laspinema palackyanum]|uniref:hypothetical protein n=1 Tax=Laspinema palackyanum TaxID=3231601 RepID=UPI00345CCBE4|nr:hypothetical protein [Laspinema sp. D2c]
MEKILTWITPGPLTEGCKFSARVVTSWITQGFALGFIAAILNGLNIATVTTGSTDPGKDFLLILLISPIAMCLWGLIGVAISSIRREELYYPGWYWYLFPWVSMFTVSWLTFGLFIAIGDLLLGTGIKLPDLPKPSGRPSKDSLRQKESNQLLDEYEDQIEQVIQNTKNKEDLDIRKRILMKLRQNPDALLEDILTEDEIEEFLEMLCEALI